jgi:hypothetical protein
MGKIMSGSSNPSRSTRLEELRDSAFLRNGGVTYVTDCGVIEHSPGFDHRVLGSALLFKGLRN